MLSVVACSGNAKPVKGVCAVAITRQSLDVRTNPGRFWSLNSARLTCDIWGLKLISFRSTDPGERLCNIWHRSTPSLRACAKSKTAAEGQTTRWFGGKTLQSINHRPHCLHSSITSLSNLSTQRKPSPRTGWAESGCSPRTSRLHSRSPTCPRVFFFFLTLLLLAPQSGSFARC